jgi:hypothetical protein
MKRCFHSIKEVFSDVNIVLKFKKPVISAHYKINGRIESLSERISNEKISYQLAAHK